MLNSIQTGNIGKSNYQQNFGMKINPELVKEGKISKSLINKLAQFGDELTILERIKAPDPKSELFSTYYQLIMSHPALGVSGNQIVPAKNLNNISDVVETLSDTFVKEAEDMMLEGHYADIKYKAPYNFIDRVNAYTEKAKQIREKLIPNSRLDKKNNETVVDVVKEETKPVGVYKGGKTINYPVEHD